VALAVAGTRNGAVVAFRLPDGEPIECPIRHFDRVDSIAFSADGRLLATGGRDGTVLLWEHSAGRFRALVTYPAAGPVVDLRFSPDGTKLAFAVENRRAADVWDLAGFERKLSEFGLSW
jgi:WD40 repeat protein